MRKALCLLVVQLLVVPIAQGHGGGLDSYGCHNDRKAGGYHCHRGQFAGESFASKNAMLAKLREIQAREAKEKAKPSAEQRLKELKELREKDLITEEQYQEKQAEILRDL